MSTFSKIDRFLLKNYRALSLVGFLLCIGIVVSGIYVVGKNERLDRAEVKAKKFDDYCMWVRTNLEGTLRTLEDEPNPKYPHMVRFRQSVADRFYELHPQLDLEFARRCTVPELDSDVYHKLRSRCEPPFPCVIAEAGDKRCAVEPACLAGIFRELLTHQPKRPY